ncbi:hypothetical protein Dvina_19035 [Dactylosporangium vinaceum]|uniref:Integral membrane protein n=1 Tax=Dactylosporangium vinaceum TaxID=53362 RepID=A0ABV5M994_9ACTN|nr:hypothetical protein [Dactylosporangium vinaceum]UAB99961.1 hypothetical protein Dvina_19035 [Dactylosporangium vinaceum]
MNLFAAALLLVAFTCLDAWLIPSPGLRLALLAAAVTVIAERVADPRAALGCATLAFAFGNGFLQHHTGTLAWSTPIDYPFTLALAGGAALGLSLGQARLAWRRHRRLRPFRALLSETAAGGDGHASRSHQDGAGPDRQDLSVRP